jgi:hypothetical protein
VRGRTTPVSQLSYRGGLGSERNGMARPTSEFTATVGTGWCFSQGHLTSTGKGPWRLEEITSDFVRGEATRFIGEALTRIAVPRPADPPRGYLMKGRVTKQASGEPKAPVHSHSAGVGEPKGPVTVLSIKAAAERDEHVNLSVELGHVTSGPQAPWFARHFTDHFQRALGINSLGHTAFTIRFSVKRDELKDAVRAIPLAVAEFNESYPSLLAEHEHERKKAEDDAKQDRLKADQQVIDRLMGES